MVWPREWYSHVASGKKRMVSNSPIIIGLVVFFRYPETKANAFQELPNQKTTQPWCNFKYNQTSGIHASKLTWLAKKKWTFEDVSPRQIASWLLNQPIWKIYSQIGSFPQVGVKINNPKNPNPSIQWLIWGPKNTPAMQVRSPFHWRVQGFLGNV